MAELTTTDTRSTGVRAVVRFGVVVALVLGLPLAGFGLLGIGTGIGQTMLCLGGVLLVAAAGGIARERVERQHLLHPPRPRLEQIDGEPALHLPRSRGRSAVSAWTTTGLAVVALAGGALALASDATAGGVVLLVVGALLLAVARPWRIDAGGVWATPERLVHSHDGVRWSVDWEDVTGSWKNDPVPVMVRAGRLPQVRRGLTGARRRGPVAGEDTLWIEATHVAGGPVLVSYVVLTAVADRRFRAALGTPESLPPTG